MQTSSASALALLLSAAAVWSVSSASCATIGTGCIRNSDCSSDQICLASTCQIDPSSLEPQEGGPEVEASPPDESSTLPPAVDSSPNDADAATADATVIIPSPDAKSSDVSTSSPDASDSADSTSSTDALDATGDAPEGD